MSYKATRDLKQTRDQMQSPTKKPPVVQPEDNWDLVGNPSVFFDELPQPYRFINKCLSDMILKPVAEKITEIEERKKTTEYEGFIREATATGSMDISDVTCMHKMGTSVGPGGSIDKEQQVYVSHKVLAGTNHGAIMLIDTQRKMTLDTIKVPGFDARRVLNMSSATIEWVGTQLTYVAAVARGSPTI